MVKLFPKTEETSIKICYGLYSDEFECRCNYPACRAIPISEALIEAYEAFRKLVGVPLKVNSGHRCTQHNMDEKGSALSRHQFGQAIDISRDSLAHLTDEEIVFAAKKCGFTYIYFGNGFFHMDVR